MSVRETLNEKPWIGVTSGAVLLVVAVGLIVWTSRPAAIMVDNAYYSADDGATFFVDSIQRIAPFDHNGKPAYRAFVYQCEGEEPFVSYLAKYTDSAHKRLAEIGANPTDPALMEEYQDLKNRAIEVRKPGQEEWVGLFSAAGDSITRHPQCADGSTARGVSP